MSPFHKIRVISKHLEWLIPKVMVTSYAIVAIINIMRSFLLIGLHVLLYCVYVDFYFFHLITC